MITHYNIVAFGGLSGATSFSYIYILFPFKNFLYFSLPTISRVHGARGFRINLPLLPLFSNIYPSSTRVVGFHHFILSRLQPDKLYTCEVFFCFSSVVELNKAGCKWYWHPRCATWVSNNFDSEQVQNF